MDKVPYVDTWDYVPTPPQCNSCKHFDGFGLCPAFPSGIPVAIIGNEVFHTEPFEDQEGEYVYTAETVIEKV